MKKLICIILLLCIKHTNAQVSSCNQLNFSTGTTAGWVGAWAGSTHTPLAQQYGFPGTPCSTPLITGLNSSGTNVLAYVHEICTAGNDPHVPISRVAPGHTYSLRLGNDYGYRGTVMSDKNSQSNNGWYSWNHQTISDTFTVTSQNPTITYWFAAVFTQEKNFPHTQPDQPYFKVLVFDQSCSLISCATYNANETVGNNGTAAGYGSLDTTIIDQDAAFNTTETFIYKNWTKVTVPLNNYIGQKLTIMFETSDCDDGGHSGYAYVVADCGTPPVIIPSSPYVCNGSTSTLTAPSGYTTYQWSGPGITGSPFTQTTTINAAGTYSVTLTSLGGCSVTIDTTISTTTPTITVNSPTINIGATATLTASGANSFTWSTGATTASISPSPTITTNYVVTGVIGTCTAMAIPMVTVLNGTATLLTYTCTGANQTFTVPSCVNAISVEAWGGGGGGGGGDSWGGGNGGGGAYADTILTVTPGQVLTMVVGCGGKQGGACQPNPVVGLGGFGFGTGGNGGSSGLVGCSGPGAGGGGATALQFGNNTLLVAGGGGGAGGGGNNSSGGNGGGGGQNGNTRDSAAAGILGSSSSNNGLIGATGTSDDGGAGGGGGGLLGGGGGGIINSDNGGGGGAGGTSLGAIISNGNGQMPGNPTSVDLCTSCASGGDGAYPSGNGADGGTGVLIIRYSTNVLPTINISASNSTICAGNTTTLTANGASTYTWSTSETTSTISVTPTAPTSYTVTGSNANGCISTATTNISVNPLPTISLNSLYTICDTGSATMCATGASTYTWLPFNYVNACMVVAAPATYTVIGTDANGCTNTAVTTVQIVPNPTLAVTSATICAGSQITLATIGNVTTYSWSTGETTPSITVNPTGIASYTVTGTDANGCSSSTTSTVTVSQLPQVTYTLTQDAVPHTWDVYPTYPADTTNITWDWGDGSTSTIAYPSHTYSVAGTYSICVTVTDASGCSSTYCQDDAVARLGNNSAQSNMVYINVYNGQQTTGINQVSTNQINIYPNPAQNNFTIQTNTNEKQKVEVYDVNGKQVLAQTINGTTNIDVSNLANGVYNLSIINSNTTVNKHLVIVR